MKTITVETTVSSVFSAVMNYASYAFSSLVTLVSAAPVLALVAIA